MVLVGKKAREKKAKKEKALLEVKSEREERARRINKQIIREHRRISVVVCGDTKAVDIYMKQRMDLSTPVDRYQVSIDAEAGADPKGRITERNCDLYLCVYDVRDKKTVEFLRNRVMPQVKYFNKKIAIAGLGLEARLCGGQGEVEIGTSTQLAKEYGCRGSELISCDPHQLAAGTFSLYSASYPEKFMETKPLINKSVEPGTSTSGKDKTKREKRAKEKKEKSG
ncbi:unnamed protein product [Rodentolepis nana]|uniref:Ribosome biogenesis protein RPF2 homolog n=1 Tax=Rodentolepis nana TaxID=102285 RepID=A0A0R3TTA2_RODNA|nr:unnamed protein product [Rodentolepis nana]